MLSVYIFHCVAVAAPKSASAAPEADEVSCVLPGVRVLGLVLIVLASPQGLQDWTSEPSAGLGAAQVQLLPPGLEDGDEEDVLPSAFVMGIASSLRAPSTGLWSSLGLSSMLRPCSCCRRMGVSSVYIHQRCWAVSL